MKISSQLKLVQDAFAGFYSCGLTMLESDTMKRFEGNECESREISLVTGFEDFRLERVSDNGLKLVTDCKQDSKTGVMFVETSIENNGKEPQTMEMLSSFVLSEIEGDKLHRFVSFWSAEGRHKIDNLADLGLEHSWNNMAFRVEKFGTVGSMPVRKFFPFVCIEDSKTGTFTAISLYTPSSWQIEVVIRHDDRVTLSGGIADRDFGHWTKTLKPGEKYLAPKAAVSVGTSLEEVCDKLVKAQKPDISPIDNHMGITYNEYCTTWGNPTEDKLKNIADHMAGHKVQYLVIDSGWYGTEEGYWFDYTGEWKINKYRFPNGLKPVADYIRSKGMIPGIWFEFEVVSRLCKLFNNADYLLKKDGYILNVGGRQYLDMEKENVKEYLYNSVIKTLKDAGFGYIKVDYNDTLGIGCDGPEGIGENLRQKLLATQEFFKKLREEIPDLVIENCSSGGHRLEPSMMELSSMASFSDAHEIVSLPIIAANLHYLTRPDQTQIWAVLRANDSPSRIYYSMAATFLGRVGMSGDIYDLSKDQWKMVDDAINLYENTADIIRDGFTYVNICDAKLYNDPQGGQLVLRKLTADEYEGENITGTTDCKKKNKTLGVYHRFANSVSLKEFIHNHGINLSLSNKVAEYGSSTEDFSACVFVIEE
ncbi:MAG: alpha-galactosidase [Lachnospiraceae bacterium]|nr:alpha-galactosidase [Lachnospiraceae bacterium]